MRLPNVNTNIGVLLMAAAITVVTWIVIITARFPNPSPAAPGAATAQPAQKSSTRPGEAITYVDINMKDRPRRQTPPPTH